MVCIRFCRPQGFDSLGCVAQVFPSHQVGVRVVVYHGVVFIRPGDGVDAEFPRFCVRVEAQVQPEPRRFHEHLGTAVPQELLVAGRLHVFAQRMHDVGVNVVLRGSGGAAPSERAEACKM